MSLDSYGMTKFMCNFSLADYANLADDCVQKKNQRHLQNQREVETKNGDFENLSHHQYCKIIIFYFNTSTSIALSSKTFINAFV